MPKVPLALSQRVLFGTLFVVFSDGRMCTYDAVEVGCDWFKMSNEAFFEAYGFNFNPHKHGLYSLCKKLVYAEGGK